jgi:anti-sigma B factor antagonist
LMISIEKRDKVDIINFTVDKINALITDEIREEINKVFETGNAKVILDLKGVKYIDSSGFGCLLSIMRTARNNYGIVKIANPIPEVMQVFQALHLHTVFDIYDNLDECFRAFN